jgi:Pyruvate/2-oxoacid:ferredoxin oxidoreductase delta subunit
MTTNRMTAWRKSVKSRDCFVCFDCKEYSPEGVIAHHDKSISDRPDLMYDLNNGITLCRICHIKRHVAAKHNSCYGPRVRERIEGTPYYSWVPCNR